MNGPVYVPEIDLTGKNIVVDNYKYGQEKEDVETFLMVRIQVLKLQTLTLDSVSAKNDRANRMTILIFPFFVWSKLTYGLTINFTHPDDQVLYLCEDIQDNKEQQLTESQDRVFLDHTFTISGYDYTSLVSRKLLTDAIILFLYSMDHKETLYLSAWYSYIQSSIYKGPWWIVIHEKVFKKRDIFNQL